MLEPRRAAEAATKPGRLELAIREWQRQLVEMHESRRGTARSAAVPSVRQTDSTLEGGRAA
jgi:hypothetical protein